MILDLEEGATVVSTARHGSTDSSAKRPEGGRPVAGKQSIGSTPKQSIAQAWLHLPKAILKVGRWWERCNTISSHDMSEYRTVRQFHPAMELHRRGNPVSQQHPVERTA